MKNKTLNSLLITSICIAIVLIYAMRSILFSSNMNLLTSVDGMGYSTIIIDVANNIRNFHFSTWFPIWFNGSSLLQYCPPLSYFVASIIQIFTNNITLTLKIFIFVSMLIGSIGVWYFCYLFVDKKFSFIGGVLYAIHPFLLSTLLRSGIYAQGFVFTITPWFVLVSMMCFERKERKLWAINVILTALLVMSNIGVFLMTCICMTLCFIILCLIKKNSLSELILWLLTIFLGIFLASCWVLPGILISENPAVKYFLSNDTMSWTSDWSWFTWDSRKATPKFFPMSYLVITIISSIFILLGYIKKSGDKLNNINWITFMFLLTILTFIFSFGTEYIPFCKEFIPGRILALTAMSGTILCVYLISIFFSLKIRIIKFSFLILIGVLMVSDLMPFDVYYSDPQIEIKNAIEAIPDKSNGFDKGRFSWIANVNSEISYLSYLYGFNSSNGWNIEGNKQSRFAANYNIALSSNCEQYVIKHLQNSNVRTILINKDYTRLVDDLTNTGFKNKAQIKDDVLLYNSKNSTYFMKNRRNAIIIGKELGINLNLPWLVEGKSPDLTDYTVEELNDYSIIYLCEPEINAYHLKKIETMIRTLAKLGKTVIIEQGRSQEWTILGVSPFDFTLKPNSVMKAESNVSSRYCDKLVINEQSQSTALYGLDNIYYRLHLQDSKIDLPVVGSKKVEGGEVYFIGMSLSQMLYSSVINLTGIQPEDKKDVLLQRDKSIESILLSLIDKGNPYKSIEAEAFNMTNSNWNNSGGNFKYKSTNDENVMVSIAYSPNWKIDVDGRDVLIKQFENLMIISLPAGEHVVTLKFSMTLTSKIGWALSIISFILFILLFFKYMQFVEKIKISSRKFIKYMNS